MTYEEALDYIHGTLKFGSKLGLENIKVLLEHMGNPHKELKFIHIAGTNGKGSTSAMISQILIQQGYCTGMYTSPYIEEFTERIRVNGQYINTQHLASIASRVKILIDEMTSKGYNHPTEFEIVTAIAFEYYYEMQCDFVVLEVGMGGRFDATNIIDNSLVSVITSVDLDHMEYLGDTIDKIAFEKCGIIKAGGYVSVYPIQHTEAKKVINKTAIRKNARVFFADIDRLKINSNTIHGSEFIYKDYGRLRIKLIGEHQIYNAITAINTIEIISDYHGIDISNLSIREGLEAVNWPGRIEIISDKPLFIIDGAHNVSGVDALVNSLSTYAEGKKITIIIGMLRDKDYESCISRLALITNLFIATTPLNNRALPAVELAHVIEKYSGKVVVEDDIQKAIAVALENTAVDDLICCCGSLYLVGDVRRVFR